MDAAHRAALLAASCLRTPVDPLTRAPVALYERRAGRPAAGGDGQDILDLNSSPERKQGSTMSDDCEDCSDPSKMHLSNQEYYLKLEELKNAHMETMAQLEKMYQNKLYLRDVQPFTKTDAARSAKHRSTWEKSSLQSRSIRKSFSEPDLNFCSDLDFSDVSDVELELEENHSGGSLKFENRWEELSSESFPRWTASGPSKLCTLKKGRRRKKAWSPKLTVPEPFQMTIREAKKKQQNVKSKAQIEMENNLLKKQLEEEAECQKQFRANPVPASVFIPLYHDIVKRNEERRKFIKDRRREILLTSQKPFSFIEREAQKKEMRTMQLKDLSTPDKKAKKFKAKPVPKFIYSPEISERLKEEELYREIRIQMRSEELLHNSSLPNFRLGNKHSSLKSLEASKMSGSKPRTMVKVPDFEMLHQKFQKQLQKQINMKPVTVCEPFHLRTPNIPSKRGKILEDIQKDEEKLNETRWPYASPRYPPHMRSTTIASLPLDYEEPISPRITESTRKRLQAIRLPLHHPQQESFPLSAVPLAAVIDRCLSAYGAACSGPLSTAVLSLLCIAHALKNARMAAEKHYSETLRELGLCEEFVSKKGRTAKTVRSQYPSSDGSENSGAEEGRSDNEIALQKRDSDGEEEKSAVQSGQSCEKEEEEEEEKSEAESDHYEQDDPEFESEDSGDGDVEKSSDNEELSD
ncbi:UNVERIFIED_CONTAM: hypothetical protein K2H54_043819 [Gekko kuhli]